MWCYYFAKSATIAPGIQEISIKDVNCPFTSYKSNTGTLSLYCRGPPYVSTQCYIVGNRCTSGNMISDLD